MTIEVKVPGLPESVADALLLDWSKQVGDPVARDEVLVELETDKVVLEVPSPVAGVLLEIAQESGATVVAEQVLARISESSDGDGDGSEHASASVDAGDAPVPHDGSPRSPAAHRLIEEMALDPARITGSGKDGRITKEDVLTHVADIVTPPAQDVPADGSAVPDAVADDADAGVMTPPTASVEPVPQQKSVRSVSREPMSRLRQTIAARLVESQQTAALLTTFNEVDMSAVMSLRNRYKADFEKKHGARLGFMSFFVKASVAALQEFPLLNAYIEGTDIVRHDYCDIGIAVSSPRGLVVPVLRNCEASDFADIENRIRDFGVRAEDGRISVEELSGGTFTITNGGVFGSLLSTPIVNPPQSAILGMHRIQERPVAHNGKVVIRPMMYLALSYDHRIIDGREAVQFLVTVKSMLEEPSRLLLAL